MRRINLLVLSLCLLCLLGCGKNGNRQHKQRIVYPALTESPPPPVPVTAKSVDEPAEESDFPIPSTAPVEASWMEKVVKKETIIKNLKEQSSLSKPDDPFALSEEDIEALSKIDNLEIY